MPTPLPSDQVAQLRDKYPELPEDYWRYLEGVGHGESPGGWIIYSGPIAPEEVYGESCSLDAVVLLGDDLQGFCLAFDCKARRLGEVTDAGDWEPWSKDDTFSKYARADQIVGLEGVESSEGE